MANYHRAWSKREVKILEKLYGNVPNLEIAKVLKNRSVNAIQKKANSLGLHFPVGGEIDNEYLKKLHEIVKGEDIELSRK